ncbi:glutathione-disulfide reductase [Bartonella krasnovii]|uniref:Glutathione reductase n=1 Tax=Bartonella krasnovii TaxID=2267275 RepID=A0A5B9D207_9HYPH|nr:glutathione-disulfide reductase [Bartonella krasnovii]QEE11994.1 glutathione-disulfide reductase [Bartonella krasnovii]UNF29691.1 glutathione-disulfide reductase [Bartonella krasnovii]UNF36052.1 glutathione-disulfide reductase [Bartonella krasnovii]UNF37662.1 glutathione-disulfide reductase [Bartonella krasnovii]UNF39446.1 glutathione-disulfide reductase [Bartonella krasnovii]
MGSFDFDLFVIGSGSGGVRAARLAGGLGKRVAIAEEYRVGGTCVIRGCVPKKLYVYASQYAKEFKKSTGFGWKYADPVFSWEKLVAAKNKEISRLEGLYRQGLENNNVHIYESRATFIDDHTLELSTTGERVTAEKILIATGAKVAPNMTIEGADFCLTSNEIFDLDELPKSIVIVGGGYIAVEFANILHGLGVKTTLLHRGDLILRNFDHDLRQLLSDAMIEKGISILYKVTVSKVQAAENSYNVLLSNGQTINTDQVMLATGRMPNTVGLGLERAGIEVNASGGVIVDEKMTTNIPHIWAVGDVTGHIQLTPVAIHDAMCFVKTAFENIPTKPNYDLIATAVFSQPEIGTVGLLEEEAIQRYKRLEIYRTVFRPMRNVLSGSSEKMFMKLIVDGESRIVVGAHILGENAGEMAQLIGISLKGKLTKDIFDETMAVHPTMAEELVTMYKPSYIYENGKKIES